MGYTHQDIKMAITSKLIKGNLPKRYNLKSGLKTYMQKDA